MNALVGTPRRNRGLMVVFAIMLAVAVALPALPAKADKYPNPGVIPPQAKPFGHSYGEWSNMWWQWAFSLPVVHGHEQENPLFDDTGAACAAGQSGKVWFLGGAFTPFPPPGSPAVDPVIKNRTCHAPVGTAFFFPILNAEDDQSYYFPGPYPTEEQLRANVAANMALAGNMTATIDGRPVRNLTDYVIGPGNPAISYWIPTDSLEAYFGIPSGQLPPEGTYYPMVTDGYYLMLTPLSRGTHLIHFTGSFDDFFALDITYHLIIE